MVILVFSKNNILGIVVVYLPHNPCPFKSNLSTPFLYKDNKSVGFFYINL